MRKPDFFIVGAPRCGTTAMKVFLWEHPEIFMAAGREPHFFGTDLHSPMFIRDERTYLSLFARANNEKRVGEKSVLYLYSRHAASEIKEFQLSASIIIMLRNPVDMLYSLHGHRLHITGREDILDFETALEAEEDRKRGLRIPAGTSPREIWLVPYRDRARYTQQVRRFLDTFGRENVHIIIFDDFVREPAGVYRETLRFLEVNPEFQPHFQQINANRRVRSRRLSNFITNPPQLARSFVQAVMPFSPIRKMLWSLVNLNSSYFPRPTLSPEIRKRLQVEFLPEVEQLSELLGRDLTHWCRT
ncbi:MAG: sulfotransferase domain-containing protein [bacterium]|nr:sulfotransferase domain-containing protein [bacterium]